jgi:hypothetical protein
MGKGGAKLPRHVSQEGRERLSQLAKQRHAEEGGFKSKDGKIGKKRKPSKKRIAKQVAEAALEKKNAAMILDVFKDGVHSSQPIHIRLKAAEAWLKVEGGEAQLALREADSDGLKKGREELLSILSEKLTSGHSANMLRRSLEEGVIEGVGHVIEGEEDSEDVEG